MSGVLYTSRISSLLQLYRGSLACTASVRTLLLVSGVGGGGGLVEFAPGTMGAMLSSTTVLKSRRLVLRDDNWKMARKAWRGAAMVRM